MKISKTSFIVYILKTSENTLYVGQTNDLVKRLAEHSSKSGKGSKYLRRFSSLSLVYTEEFSTRSEALKRETVIKKYTHLQKEALFANPSTITSTA